MSTGSIRQRRRGTGGHRESHPDWRTSRQKITTATLREKKLRHEPITCLTAYDYASARLVDEAGIDIVLVGDSLAQTMLGYENTLSVTMDEMLHHTKAVRRGREECVADRGHALRLLSGQTRRRRPQCGALCERRRR